jgi:hypothetical protein
MRRVLFTGSPAISAKSATSFPTTSSNSWWRLDHSGRHPLLVMLHLLSDVPAQLLHIVDHRPSPPLLLNFSVCKIAPGPHDETSRLCPGAGISSREYSVGRGTVDLPFPPPARLCGVTSTVSTDLSVRIICTISRNVDRPTLGTSTR